MPASTPSPSSPVMKRLPPPAVQPPCEANSAAVTTPGEDPLTKTLPEEVCLVIFRLLNFQDLGRCAQVCKAWRALVADGSLWQRVCLGPYRDRVLPHDLERVFTWAGDFLRVAGLEGCSSSVGNSTLRTIAKNCPNLDRLDLVSCRLVTTSGVRAVSASCTLLTSLNLSGLGTVNRVMLTSIGANCTTLRKLDISYNREVSSEGIRQLVSGCSQLEELVLTGCNTLGDDCMKMISNLVHLRVLRLQFCPLITDTGIQNLMGSPRGMPALRHLDLSSCVRLGDESLRIIAKGCPALVALEVAFCNLMTDNGFEVLTRQLKDLCKLDLEECVELTDRTLQNIGQNLPKLDTLFLSFCDKITDAGLDEISRGCKGLEYLEIDSCIHISDKAVRRCINRLPKLKEIDIFDCPGVHQQAEERNSTAALPSQLHVKFFNRDEENSRVLNSTPDPAQHKQCVIL